MHVPDSLISQVMALPAEPRAELLAMLRQSLPVGETLGATAPDEQLAAEWTEELDRRIARFRCADPRGVDAEAAFAELRKQLESDRLAWANGPTCNSQGQRPWGTIA